MKRKRNLIPAAALAMSLWGCSDSADDASDAADTGADGTGGATSSAMDDAVGDDSPADGSSGGDGVGQCGDGGSVEEFQEPPGDCFNNQGCGTCNCRTFRDNPPSEQATCVDDPMDGQLTVTATLLGFPGQTPIPSTEVTLYNAIEVGTVGPDLATVVGMTTSDAAGEIEITVEPTDQIGLIATVRADGFADTATGLAKPPYEASNAIHDLFAVPQADADAWSAALGAEPELAGSLPLGENGGVVGVARNRYTGEPVAGVTIESLKSDSTAILRYLDEDGTFNTTATSATGIYVVFEPALAEEFEARLDGAVVSTRPNKAGSGPPAIFTMNLTINVDPGGR